MKLAFSRWLFNQIHSRNLIYNQCWEDPELDHEVLEIGPKDRIVMITSAGCNALDYLLRGPAEIHCVDINPHQNALLELKLAALKTLPHRQFFEMFGEGRVRDHGDIYRNRLRECLSESGRATWDSRIHYFNPAGAGLYFNGTAGLFARSIRLYLGRSRAFRDDLEKFQQSKDLIEQAALYRSRIAPKLWSPLIRFLIRRNAVLSMLGVPMEQIAEIRATAEPDISSFVQERVDRTLTRIPISRNYFWRVYMNGFYTPDCCPNYLKPENFEILRERLGRIRIHTATMTDFLRSTEERFTIFVLLDHMDWLTSAPELLAEEWRYIMRSALPGARIIYRSGGLTGDYLPRFAMQRLEFQSDRTRELHRRDRVGTYGSFHFARVTT